MMRSVPENYWPLIAQMQFYGDPQISWSRYLTRACSIDDSDELTELGTYLQSYCQGATLFDLPCGNPALHESDDDCDLFPLWQQLGIHTWVEVDRDATVLADRITESIEVCKDGAYQLANQVGPIGQRDNVFTTQDDLLGFLAKQEPSVDQGAIFYVSGLQPNQEWLAQPDVLETVAVPYLQFLYEELARLTREDDLIIFNDPQTLVTGMHVDRFPAADSALAMLAHGFVCERVGPQQKVWVYRKIA